MRKIFCIIPCIDISILSYIAQGNDLFKHSLLETRQVLEVLKLVEQVIMNESKLMIYHENATTPLV